MYHLTFDLLEGVVEEQALGMRVTEEEKRIIADYHKYAFVGIMLDWIKNGMKQDPEEIVENTSKMLKGTISLSLKNCSK